MQITATITGISYNAMLPEELHKITFSDFNINSCAPSCAVSFEADSIFALSKWVSPKRTRSYPYERVYNTLSGTKKITIIPIIKDEGADGDRDFIQWDTISLMSLFDVYIIFAYYSNADKNKAYANKITNQIFDNEYIKTKIIEISKYHSSALHWNIQELNFLGNLTNIIKNAYEKISQNTGVKMHKESGINAFGKKLSKGLGEFKKFSREKAQNAQEREYKTIQPKEILATLTKSKITITNYLGGKYFFTVDETEINNDTIYLIESKHAKTALLPSISDIKDGLLKMVLYSNFASIQVNGAEMQSHPQLVLTSSKLKSKLIMPANNDIIQSYFSENPSFSENQKTLVCKLSDEAKENNFSIILKPMQ